MLKNELQQREIEATGRKVIQRILENREVGYRKEERPL